MRHTKRALYILAAVLAVIATLSPFSYTQTAQTLLTRHVRQEVASGQAPIVGRLPATQSLLFDIVMPLRDRPGLQSLISEQYDPTSPLYHKFITPQEVTERFGPSQKDWDTLVAFAKAGGFEIIGGTREGRDLWLRGTVANIEKAFHVTMGVYQDPTEAGRTFFATDREPTADLPFQLWHITGLDNNSKPHPLYVTKSDYAKAHGVTPEEIVSNDGPGSGSGGSFLGSDMRAAYYCNGTCGSGALTGTGQNIALFEMAGTDLADLTTYYSNVGQTEPYTPTLISTGGYATTCLDSGGSSKACDDIEQTIDMQQAMGMAPGSTMTYMYVCGAVLANGTGNASDSACISAMVTTTAAPLSKQIGCSWGWSPADESTLDPYFEQMATQGQNFFVASGDSAKWSSSNTAWPADDPYVVGVGGTDLTTVSAGGAWKSETAWNDSGGGVSTSSVPIPSWQTPVDGCSGCSKTLRNGPDVSAMADCDFYYCGDQKACGTGLCGTSFAAPMWAGYLALANQQAATNGESIGFINPIIYPQAELGGTTYSNLFHDITSGSCGDSSGTGFDLCTGWGTPNGSGLINLLAPTGGSTPQTITCSTVPPSSEVYNGSFTIACTASSGLAVTYTSSGGCSNSGATYTMTSGTTACTVDVNQSGNSTYAAAPQVAYSVSATLASQTITFTTNAPSSATYGSNFTVAATASSGLAVTYTSSGGCSNSGATYTMTSGTTACSVMANQAGNTNYSAATQVTETVTANPATATITFSNLTLTYTGSALSPTVTTSPSGLSYSSTGYPDTSAGSYPVTATITNTNYTATPANGTFVINPAAATIGFSNLTQTYTGSALSPTVTTVPAGLSYSSTGYPDTAAGSYPVTATITNSNYTGSANGTFVVNKASQTISFTTNAPASAVYNSPFTVAASATSGLAVVYSSAGACTNSGATYTMTSGTGTCSVIANQAGNTNYNAASQVTETVAAAKATNTVTFTTAPPASAAYNSQFTVAASGLGTGAITYTSGGGCTNSGGTYTMTSGTNACSVTATQATDTNYLAGSTSASVAATPATATVTFSNLTQTYTGSVLSPTVTTSPSGLSYSDTGYPDTSAGSYPVTATITNSNYTGSASGTFVISQASQTITFTTPAPASAEYGASFTVAANGGGSGNAVAYTSAGACTNSGATYTMTSGTGACSVIANQAGNNNYAAAPQVTETTAATLANGSVSVASSVNPSADGQAVTFTATITSDTSSVKGRATRRGNVKSNVVSGTVNWSSDTGCGTTNVTSGYPGTATCTISTLAPGTYAITATYSGDANHNGAAGTLSGGQVVNQPLQAATSTTVGSSLDPSVYGQAVNFTATVTAGSGTPTGTVQFSIDGNAFGSPVTLVSGTAASGSIATLAVGTHTVTAAYAGATTYAPSTGTLSGGQAVTAATAGTAVTSGANPSAYGAAVTFTATISGEYGLVKGRNGRAKSHDVTGTVTWSANTGCSTTTVTSGNPGTATCTTSSLAEGSDTVTANYSGDANHSGSSGNVSQTINQATTSISVTNVSPNHEDYGLDAPVTITAVLSWSGSGAAPTAANVTIGGNGNGTYGATSCGAASGDAITCTATYTPTPADVAGSYTETASFTGDANYNSSSSSQTNNFTINNATSGTLVSSSLNPSVYGQPVTFTVTINGENGNVKGRAGRRGDIKSHTVTGSVTWSANTGCGTTPVSAGNPGTAACTTSSLNAGGDTVTAAYSGDANHSGSTGSVSQTVDQASQTITFTTNAPSSAVYNSSFTVAAAASSSLPVAYTSVGQCTNSGATYTMNSGTGACFVIVNQAGNANYAAAPEVTQTVNASKANPAVTFSGLPGSLPYGSTYALTAVTNVSTTAVITDSTTKVCTLSGSTVSVVATSGTCTVTATWAADSNYNSATASLSGTAAKGTPVISWGTPAAIGYGTKLSGTQLDATANIAGTFKYSPASGKVLTAGSQTLSATFTPTNKNYSTATASVTLTVNPAASTTAITSGNSVTLKNGTATYKAAFTVGTYKAAGSVTVTFVNGGSTLSCTDASIPATGKGTCNLALTTADEGTWTVTATYAGDNNHTGSTSAPITLTVNP